MYVESVREKKWQVGTLTIVWMTSESECLDSSVWPWGSHFSNTQSPLPEGNGHWFPNWLWIEIQAPPLWAEWAEVLRKSGQETKKGRVSNISTLQISPVDVATDMNLWQANSTMLSAAVCSDWVIWRETLCCNRQITRKENGMWFQENMWMHFTSAFVLPNTYKMCAT